MIGHGFETEKATIELKFDERRLYSRRYTLCWMRCESVDCGWRLVAES
jgi:hypothetical protein